MTRPLILLTEAWPPDSGGVATSARRVAHALNAQGVPVVVFTFDGSRPLDSTDYCVETSEGEVSVLRFGPFFLKKPADETRSLSEKHRAVFRRRAFDAMERRARALNVAGVLSFYVLNAGWIATYLARSLGVPHVLGVRGNDVGRNIFSVDRMPVVQLTCEQADIIACVNEHLRRRLLLAFPQFSGKTEVVPNGVDGALAVRPGAREELRRVTGWYNGEIVAAFIGTPREKKGIACLLEAICELPQGSPIRILIVGPELSGSEKRWGGSQWEELVAENRLFATGLVSREEARFWASGADIVTMPSLDDGMANGLLEGIILGLCPVVSDVFCDVVSSDCGWIVPPAQPALLARSLHEAATRTSERLRRAAAARTHVLGTHTPEREAKAYMEIFQRLGSLNK